MRVPIHCEYGSRRRKLTVALLLICVSFLLESDSLEAKLPLFEKSTREIISGMTHVHMHA